MSEEFNELSKFYKQYDWQNNTNWNDATEYRNLKMRVMEQIGNSPEKICRLISNCLTQPEIELCLMALFGSCGACDYIKGQYLFFNGYFVNWIIQSHATIVFRKYKIKRLIHKYNKWLFGQRFTIGKISDYFNPTQEQTEFILALLRYKATNSDLEYMPEFVCALLKYKQKHAKFPDYLQQLNSEFLTIISWDYYGYIKERSGEPNLYEKYLTKKHPRIIRLALASFIEALNTIITDLGAEEEITIKVADVRAITELPGFQDYLNA